MATALVTGASSGIGEAFAHIFAKEKYDLVLVARRKEKLHALKKKLEEKYGISVHVFSRDLSLRDSTQDLYDRLQEKRIVVDVLVNNAGFGSHGHFIDETWEREEQMIRLNITALTHLTKLFARDMVKRKQGYILNVASVAGFFPGPMMNVYYSTKAYVLHFSEALANELSDTGVHVTALCPGRTVTGFQDAAKINDKIGSWDGGPSAYDVALYGYNAMLRGKRIAVPGWKNKILVFLPRLLPRALAVFLVRRFQDRKR